MQRCAIIFHSRAPAASVEKGGFGNSLQRACEQAIHNIMMFLITLVLWVGGNDNA
jgi:hypothetical protein